MDGTLPPAARLWGCSSANALADAIYQAIEPRLTPLLGQVSVGLSYSLSLRKKPSAGAFWCATDTR